MIVCVCVRSNASRLLRLVALSALECEVCGEVRLTLSFFHSLFIVFSGSTKVSSIYISVAWSPFERYHFVLDLRCFNHLVDVLTISVV